jgi:hypothetical protein
MEKEPPLVVEAAKEGSFVLYGGSALYSRVYPRSAPERIAASIDLCPETLYIVPSPLLGYGLATLLERLPDSSFVLAMEAEPPLADLSLSCLPKAVMEHPRFRFLSVLSLSARDIQNLGRFRRSAEISLSFGRKLHARVYDSALRCVDAEISRYWRNRMTMIHMGRLWMRNIVRNLGFLADADLRSPKRWDAPIVVCGAGPSLDAICPWISRERRRLRVLACDTAVGPLSAWGIAPDAVVCLEGQIYNLKDFLPTGGSETPLYVDITAHPSSFHAIQGPKVLTLTRFEELKFLDRLEALPLPALRVPPLGSVGVLALHIAQSLTDGPVFLAGLDFSFPRGRTHARGASALRAEEQKESRTYKARAQWRASFAQDTEPAGRGERTNAVLSSYADLLSREIGGDSRIMDIRPTGLSLGPARSSFDQASGLLDLNPAAAGPSSLGPALDRSSLASTTASFLADERSRLAGLREALRSDSPDLSALVADCDWIYSWFPDEHRVPGLPGDVRNRLLAEVLDWRRRFDEALADTEAP